MRTPKRSLGPVNPIASLPLLVGSYCHQEVGNDVTPKWAIYKFSELTHLVSQLDHACSRLRLFSPEAFGRPLGIPKIVAVRAPMQTRA